MPIWLATIALVWAPGYLLMRATGATRTAPFGVSVAVEIAAGLALWPLAFLATLWLPMHWTATAGRVIAMAVIVAAAALLIARSIRLRHIRARLRIGVPLALILALAFATRWSHIRNLQFPPWVDGLHHGAIIRVLMSKGAIPATLDPVVPGASLEYHWGYHATLAFLGWLVGVDSPVEIPRLMLISGQALNALSVVMLYAAGRVLLKSREGALTTAALGALVSFFPAYYLSWGRYTHLAGTLVLAPLVIVLWSMHDGRRLRAKSIVGAVLTLGLVLIHVRIAFFAGLFALVLAARLVQRRQWRTIALWAAIAAVAGVLVAPWLLRLSGSEHVRAFVAPRYGEAPDIHQSIPLDVLWSTHNRELLAVATAGLSGMTGYLGMPVLGRALSAAWWALLIWASRFPARDRRARRLTPWPRIALVTVFVALVGTLLWIRLSWLDLTRFASVSSALITLFLPLSLAGAGLVTWFVLRVAPPRFSSGAAIGVALALAGGGAWLMRDIINPVTLLTTAADDRSVHWIERNVPRNALFAVDARPWMAPAWSGVDGGCWIGVATTSRSILPPSIYAWTLPAARVDAINRLLASWTSGDSRSLDSLLAAGVTHIYIGSPSAEALHAFALRDPRVKLIHREGAVGVYEVRAGLTQASGVGLRASGEFGLRRRSR